MNAGIGHGRRLGKRRHDQDGNQELNRNTTCTAKGINQVPVLKQEPRYKDKIVEVKYQDEKQAAYKNRHDAQFLHMMRKRHLLGKQKGERKKNDPHKGMCEGLKNNFVFFHFLKIRR